MGLSGTRRRVLVVDDDEDNVDVIAAVLEAVGHEVHRTSFRRDVPALAVACAPDVVVLDLGLADLDTGGVVDELKRLPDPPLIIAFTGWHRLEAEARAAGCYALVLKPAVREVLALITRADLTKGRATGR